MFSTRSVILIVDDDPAVREILAILLEAEGFVVEEAEDSAAGLERLARGGIDLVLVDMMLPGVDGLEFCRAVRSRPATAYLPIVLVSASIDRTARAAALASGADDFVAKPIDSADLYNRVHSWLGARQPAAGDQVVARVCRSPGECGRTPPAPRGARGRCSGSRPRSLPGRPDRGLGPTLAPATADQVWSLPRAVRLEPARGADERASARRQFAAQRSRVGRPMRSTLGLAALFLLAACSAGPSARRNGGGRRARAH